MKASRMTTRAALCAAIASTMVPLAILQAGGCVVQPDATEGEAEQIGTAEQELLKGVLSDNQAEMETVVVGECSGALLTREWAIVAKHCMPTAMDPANPLKVWYGVKVPSQPLTGAQQVRDVVEMVHHPASIDLTLVRVNAPFNIGGDATKGFRRAVFPGTSGDFTQSALTCVGFEVTKPLGVLTFTSRTATRGVAEITTNTGAGDVLKFKVIQVAADGGVPNSADSGAITGPADSSGAVCFVHEGTGSAYLAGVISGGSDLDPDGLYKTTFVTSIASGSVGGAPSVRQWLNETVYRRFAGAVVGENNNKCLEIDQQAFSAGVAGDARFWTCGGGAHQKWSIPVAWNGVLAHDVRLRQKDPVHNLSWYLDSDSITSHQAFSTATSVAQWRWQNDAIVGYGDRCIGRYNSANHVSAMRCDHPDFSPQWLLNSINASAPYTNTFRNEGLCLDVAGGAFANGAVASLAVCNGAPTQKWLQFVDGTIRPANSPGYCLEIPGHPFWPGDLQLWNCTEHAGARQQFYYRGRLKEIAYWPVAPKCLDAKDYGTANGTRAQDLLCNGSSAQHYDYFPSDHFPGK